MAILVPRWLDSSWQVRLQMCLKFCMTENLQIRTYVPIYKTKVFYRVDSGAFGRSGGKHPSIAMNSKVRARARSNGL